MRLTKPEKAENNYIIIILNFNIIFFNNKIKQNDWLYMYERPIIPGIIMKLLYTMIAQIKYKVVIVNCTVVQNNCNWVIK